MIYIFVFTGEFGFELLNWQGTVRKFASTISSEDYIVCCSRAQVYPLYKSAARYIEISEVESFKKSRAREYMVVSDADEPISIIRTPLCNYRVNTDIRTLVLQDLEEDKILKYGPYRFIFSSEKTILHGCNFGINQYASLGGILIQKIHRYARKTLPVGQEILEQFKLFLAKQLDGLYHRGDGEIYASLNCNNVIFSKIEADLSCKSSVEEKLGWKLAEPFILCQARQRTISAPSQEEIPIRELAYLIRTLAGKVKVVLLSFHTGRWLDSYSQFETTSGCSLYHCTSFPEQACLIHFAGHCVFFTEGDFGSHIYVPPLMGKNVTAVAPQTVFQQESAPIEFWNQYIFQFGGQILPKTTEEIFSSPKNIHAAVDGILEHVHG